MALDLTTLEQKRAALEARLASTTAALKETARRDDARRKIVLGGALMAAVRDGAVPADIMRTLLPRMAERDRRLFVRPDAAPAPSAEGGAS
ncbi:hypothetical protein [Methylopila sp. M107]|uniref:hypothetical protein n=1 Tax=Methylopila sp. M107 TaxID=1101190 RepID=UPI0003826C34|nr:hypothetical protein [Methylopila sp. M107]